MGAEIKVGKYPVEMIQPDGGMNHPCEASVRIVVAAGKDHQIFFCNAAEQRLAEIQVVVMMIAVVQIVVSPQDVNMFPSGHATCQHDLAVVVGHPETFHLGKISGLLFY